VSRDLCAILRMMVAKNPVDRYPNPVEVQKDFEMLSTGGSLVAHNFCGVSSIGESGSRMRNSCSIGVSKRPGKRSKVITRAVLRSSRRSRVSGSNSRLFWFLVSSVLASSVLVWSLWPRIGSIVECRPVTLSKPELGSESKPKPESNKPEPNKPESNKPEPNKPESKPNKPESKPNKPESKPNKPESKPNKPELEPELDYGLGFKDLSKIVYLKRDCSGISWVEKDGIFSSPRSGTSYLAIPYSPSDEYDVGFMLIRDSGRDYFLMKLGSQGSLFSVYFKNGQCGLKNVRGAPCKIFCSNRVSPLSSQPCQVLIRVRRGSVELSCNNVLMFCWEGDFSRLSVSNGLNGVSIRYGPCLGILTFNMGVSIGGFYVKCVSGRGRLYYGK
jgi:cell division septation protein DedD